MQLVLLRLSWFPDRNACLLIYPFSIRDRNNIEDRNIYLNLFLIAFQIAISVISKTDTKCHFIKLPAVTIHPIPVLFQIRLNI